MKFIYHIFTMLLLANSLYAQTEHIDVIQKNSINFDKQTIQFTELQLENFLDSIGSLSPSLWANNITFVADSTLQNQQQLKQVISQTDFSKLKQAINAKENIDRTIDLKTAKSIFGDIDVDSAFINDGIIPITFYSFDKVKTDLNEYAICLGNPNADWNCILYFFKGNKIIAKHSIRHRYGLELEHYKDKDGKTIIYYKVNFGSGTGAWQFNFHFYKYYDNKLIPILSELEKSNLNAWGNYRNYWLESSVSNTKPLTLKMIFSQELLDPNGDSYSIVHDSTLITYHWNEQTKTLIGNYDKSKINKFQTLAYYLADNELLFINTYYSILKECLKHKEKRQLMLFYLNEVKNNYNTK